MNEALNYTEVVLYHYCPNFTKPGYHCQLYTTGSPVVVAHAAVIALIGKRENFIGKKKHAYTIDDFICFIKVYIT